MLSAATSIWLHTWPLLQLGGSSCLLLIFIWLFLTRLQSRHISFLSLLSLRWWSWQQRVHSGTPRCSCSWLCRVWPSLLLFHRVLWVHKFSGTSCPCASSVRCRGCFSPVICYHRLIWFIQASSHIFMGVLLRTSWPTSECVCRVIDLLWAFCLFTSEYSDYWLPSAHW